MALSSGSEACSAQDPQHYYADSKPTKHHGIELFFVTTAAEFVRNAFEVTPGSHSVS
jgi:hypothetical protein